MIMKKRSQQLATRSINTTPQAIILYGVLGLNLVMKLCVTYGQTPTVKGVEGILSAYRSVFRSGGIIMSGPTVFVKAMQAAAVRAKNYVCG